MYRKKKLRQFNGSEYKIFTNENSMFNLRGLLRKRVPPSRAKVSSNKYFLCKTGEFFKVLSNAVFKKEDLI